MVGVEDQLADLFALLPGSAPAATLELVGPPSLHSAFDVERCAALSVAAAALAARSSGSTLVLDRRHLATALAARLLIDGEAPRLWADLSGYYTTRDGRGLQLHCNFPQHAWGVVEQLGLGSRAAGGALPERACVEARIAERDADELEAELVDAGLIAAKLRSLAEWDVHPHAEATRDLPLISFESLGADAPPRAPLAGGAGTPLEGLRVLDTSRVLAGPVACRSLAAHGADVLRLGAAQLPSIEPAVILTGMGKRNAELDLDEPGALERFEALLAGADVWIDAFRPGAFARRGLSAERAAELSPGVVVVQISAFDWTGPWSGRRGFDSIVQSTTGIVDEGSRRSGAREPVPLPVQALDFATGYLAAFAAQRLAAHQARVGGSWRARLSLLRTRNWLVGLAPPRDFSAAKPGLEPRFSCELQSDFGHLVLPQPLFGSWRSAPARLGTSAASWWPRGGDLGPRS